MKIELITICALLGSVTGLSTYAMGKPAPEASPIPPVFNSCSCEVTKSRAPLGDHGWGEKEISLMGRSFVKAADGSISKQETLIGQWVDSYRSNTPYNQCKSERRNQEMANICPQTESSDEK